MYAYKYKLLENVRTLWAVRWAVEWAVGLLSKMFLDCHDY